MRFWKGLKNSGIFTFKMIKKLICSFLIGTIFSASNLFFVNIFPDQIEKIFGVEKALAKSEEELTKINLVTILVERDLFASGNKFLGLQDKEPDYLKEDSISDRILRYAQDVQKALPYTKAVIIQVDRAEKVKNIVDVLEKLYFEGDGADDEFNRLSGVVLIGDLPLPVVNKNGNHFASMYPYTDFVDKRYVFDNEAREFILNKELDFFQPEIWHGVIKAPASGSEGEKMLAEYFDKNHLFHENVGDYAKFDRKILYQDFINEPKELSDEKFLKYDLFINHLEDIAYMRYNKDLAYELYTLFNGELIDGDGIDNDGDGLIDEELKDGVDNDGDGLIDEDIGDAFNKRDNDGDGLIDEDGTDDNDADGDGQMDEDPPGDMNGDGCPGICGVDDDNDAADSDNDGYCDGQEKEAGTSPYDDDDHPRVPALPFSRWIDEGDPNDDDEDGLVDEDGIEDNDADGDGKIDEDPAATTPDSKEMFKTVPDIMSETIINKFFLGYEKLFNGYLSEINDSVRNTGYFREKYDNGKGAQRTEVDSAVTLIAKKDLYTMQYLRVVNDEIEKIIDNIISKIQQNIPLISDVSITGVANVNDLVVNLKPYTFINHSRLEKVDGKKLYNVRYYILGKQYYVENDDDYSRQVKSPMDCTLYRGSAALNGGSTSIMVEANRVFDFTSASYTGEEIPAGSTKVPSSKKVRKANAPFAGCYGANAQRPLRCFSDAAWDPVFNIAGTKRIPNDIAKNLEVDWRACYQFKEKETFHNYLYAKDKSVEDYFDELEDADSEEERAEIEKTQYPDHWKNYELKDYIILDVNTKTPDGKTIKAQLNMQQVFDMVSFKGFSDMVEKVITGEPLEFKILEPIELDENTIIKDLMLKVDPKKVGDIISIFEHKEPTLKTVSEQFKAGFSMDMPIDDPRYSSFRDFTGKFQEVIYPNVFRAKDLNDFKKIIENKIEELNQIPGGVNYTADLKNILDKEAGKLDETHIDDAIKWKKMNINTKHAEILKSFLNPDIKPYVSNSKPNYGYEAAFISAEGNDKELFYGIDPSFGGEETDSEFNNLESLQRTENSNNQIEDKNELFDFDGEENKSKDKEEESKSSSGDNSGGIVAWLKKWSNAASYLNDLKIWLDESKDIGFDKAKCGTNEDKNALLQKLDKSRFNPSYVMSLDETEIFEEQPIKDSDSDGIPDSIDDNPTNKDVNSNMIPDGAEATIGIKLDIKEKVLKANTRSDIYNLDVQTLDSLAKINSYDNFSKIAIIALTPEEAKTDLRTLLKKKIIDEDTGGDLFTAMGINPIQIVKGKSGLQIQPNDYEGEFYLAGITLNNNEVISNLVKLKTTSEKIKVYSYLKRIVEEKIPAGTEIIEEINVYDDENNLIGKINPETGNIVLENDNYELIAEASNLDYPLRVYVREKNTNKNYVAIIYKPKEEIVNIIDSSISLNSENLIGINISDVNLKDNIRLAYSETTISNVDIFEGSKKIAILTPNGDFFIGDKENFTLKAKENDIVNGPMIFQFLNKSGDILAQFVIENDNELLVLDNEGNLNKLLNNEEIGRNVSFKNFKTPDSQKNNWIGKAMAAYRMIPDTDNDGLNDYEEFLLKTSPTINDTDGDGYTDAKEIEYGYDPLKKNKKLFSDLERGHEGFKDIMELYLRGVIKGYNDGTFKPDKKITREEFMKLDLGAICISCDKFNNEKKSETLKIYNQNPFPDTKNINPQLLTCAAEGKNRNIVSGYKSAEYENYFLPQKEISFAEATKILLETAKIPLVDVPITGDKPWFYKYVLTAQKASLFPKNRFKELDSENFEKFKIWFDTQIAVSGNFIDFLNSSVSRAEFAIMTGNIRLLKDCKKLDSDYDGIPDSEEIYVYGTNPFKADTDNGGMVDLEEILNGYDPLNFEDDKNNQNYDSDNDKIPNEYELENGLDPNNKEDAQEDNDLDSLTNLEEYFLGTDLNKKDTDLGGTNDYDEVKIFNTNPLSSKDDKRKNDSDNDGLSDDIELKINTDPFKADSDNGGESDYDEFINNRNPLNPNDDQKNPDKDNSKDFYVLDTDGDGLTDSEEIKYGTSLTLWDTDSDGMSDYSEIFYNTDPLDKNSFILDADKDGLSDEQELKIRTSTVMYDTDMGGESDGSEFNNNKNPLDPKDDDKDSDKDGLSDKEEIIYGTDPFNWDTDSGGESDLNEILTGSDPFDRSDDNFDEDKDGLSDKQEIEFGSNPLLSDTDFGGEIDGAEKYRNSNPNNSKDDKKTVYDDKYDSKNYKDSDNGGECDASEKIRGANYLNKIDDFVNANINDCDGDGIINDDEKLYFTDPNNWDSDGGGQSDYSEINEGKNPLDPSDDNKNASIEDFDGDGLKNSDEYNKGLNINSKDTDKGGENDFEEIKNSSNPLDPNDDNRLKDSDNDGLSDIDEITRYLTDAFKVDTDAGGVSDFDEIKNNTDPLDPSDDNKISSGKNWNNENSASNSRVKNNNAENISNEIPSSDFIDTDKDLLSDIEERKIGTDINNMDTDSDSVSDYDEILMGTNPLKKDNPSENSVSNDLYSGVNIAGEFIETIYEQPLKSEMELVSSRIPAGSDTYLYLKAQIEDKNGETKISDNSSMIIFSIIEGNNSGVIKEKSVQVKNGIAETIINAQTLAGMVKVEARLSKQDILPKTDYSLDVYALAPDNAILEADSRILVSGGYSRSNLQVILQDKFGNLANTEVATISVESEGPIVMETTDEDDQNEGIQLKSLSGMFNIPVKSADKGTGIGKVKVTYANNKKAEFNFKVVDDVILRLSADSTSVQANNQSEIKISVETVDEEGQIYKNFNPEIKFSMSDEGFGQFINGNSITLNDGEGEIFVRAGTMAGKAQITALGENISPAFLNLKFLPNEAEKTVLNFEKEIVKNNRELNIQVLLFDKYGNLATNDSKTKIRLKLTEGSAKFAQIIDGDVKSASRGKAIFKIKTNTETGKINLMATPEGLSEGRNISGSTLSIKSMKSLGKNYLRELNANVLYTVLLGMPAGKIYSDDYFGGHLLINGKTQAISTVTEELEQNKILANINFNGKLDLLDESSMAIKPLLNGNNPIKFEFFQILDRVSLGEAIIKIDNNHKDLGIISKEDLLDDLKYGIYARKEIEDNNFSIKKRLLAGKNVLSIFESDIEKVRIYDNLAVKIFDPEFLIFNEDSYSYPAFRINKGALNIASIIIWQNFSDTAGVKILDENFNMANFNNLPKGVYFSVETELDKFVIRKTFTGNSTKQPTSLSLFDKSQEMTLDRKPGMNATSLESVLTKTNIGFDGDNKNLLYFSAGTPAGEANKSYMSDIGIVLGDPSIKKVNRGIVSSTGYTKDVGRLILSGSEMIKDITMIDINSDDRDDILVAYEDGKFTLLENLNSDPRYYDRGTVLNLVNGVIAIDKGDINNDSSDDIVVATKDSCLNDEICVYVYENHDGSFVRKNLNLDIVQRVHDLKVADMNNDNFDDIIVSDYGANVRIYYNVNGNVNTEGQLAGSLAPKADSNLNLKEEVLAYYKGMTTNNEEDSFDDQYFLPLPINNNKGFSDSTNPEEINNVRKTLSDLAKYGVEVEMQGPNKKDDESFVYLDYDKNLKSSNKKAVDLNGGLIEIGDKIQYTLTLKNTGTNNIDKIFISDVIPTIAKFQPESVKCLNCGQDEVLVIEETGKKGRDFIFTGIKIPASNERIISYEISINSLPKINLETGNNMSDEYKKDNYRDIWAQIEGNDTGRSIYFYSDNIKTETFIPIAQSAVSKLKYVQVQYKLLVTEPLSDEETAKVIDELQPDMPDQKDLELGPDGSLPKFLQEKVDCRKNKDCDKDGVPDQFNGKMSPKDKSTIEKAGEALDEVAETVENLVTSMKCSGGCLPTPINLAFLTPGPINILGAISGISPGMPAFGCCLPTPLGPILPCVGPTCYGSLFFRYYIDTTLTILGAGTVNSFCFGPYPGGICLAFPSIDKGTTDSCGNKKQGQCEKIQKWAEKQLEKVNKVVAEANKAVSDAANTVNGAISTSGSSAQKKTRNESGGMVGTEINGYKVNAVIGTNFSLPAMPILADWVKRQWEEIHNKLLSDPPDLFIISPSFNTIGSAVIPTKNFSDVRNLNEFLAYLNSIPLIKVRVKQIPIKIPILPPEELERKKYEWEQWVKDAKKEVKRVEKQWANIKKEKGVRDAAGYLLYELDEEVTDKVGLDTAKFIAAVEENIANLETWKRLPYEIRNLTNIESYYLKQIICYLDAITEFTGGYIMRNFEKARQWLNAIGDFIEAVKNWKLVMKAFIAYEESCSTCETDRFSLLELILRLFAAIPEIPVVPLPKWPDLIVDFSNIKGGVEIEWPEFDFKPEPLILPPLPALRLPDIPTLSFKLPSIPVIPPAPNFTTLLPTLPPLPLPKLPDLPPAPPVPGLPNELKIFINILQKILKILCLIKNGDIFIPEMMLRTQIEIMTQRKLTPLLPLDLSFPILAPQIEYDFVRRIKLTASLDFNIDTSFVYKTFKHYAEKWNLLVQDEVNSLNVKMLDVKNRLDEQIEKAIQEVENKMQEAAKDIEKAGQKQLDKGQEQTDKAQKNLDKKEENMDKNVDDLIMFESEESAPLYIRPLISDLKQSYKELSKASINYQEQILQTPKNYRLIAYEEILNPNDPLMNRSLKELKNNKNKYDLEKMPESAKKLMAFKDQLIDYAEKREDMVKDFNDIHDLNQSLRIIAQINNEKHNILASTDVKGGNVILEINPNDEIISLLNESNQNVNQIKNLSPLIDNPEKALQDVKMFVDDVIEKNEKVDTDLIAATTQSGNGSLSGGGLSGGFINLGNILVENAKEGTLERLFNYEFPKESENRVEFTDFDLDNDLDVIYSSENNLYLKENLTFTSNKKIITKKPKVYDLIDFKVEHVSINNPIVSEIKNEKITLEFERSPIEDSIFAYEIEFYQDVHEMDLKDKKYDKKSGRINVIKETSKVSKYDISPFALYTIIKGNAKIEREYALLNDDKVLGINDKIITDENSEAIISFSDGSQLLLKENSEFKMPDVNEASEIHFENGDFVIKKKSGNNVLIQNNRIIIASNQAKVEIEINDEENVIIQNGKKFNLNDLKKSIAYVSDLDGEALLDGFERKILNKGKQELINGGRIIHVIKDSEIILKEIFDDQEIELGIFTLLEQSRYSLDSNVIAEIKSGEIEVINPERFKKNQKVISGMELNFGDKIYVKNFKDSAQIQFPQNKGVSTFVNGNETFMLMNAEEISGDKKASLELALDNGNYFSQINVILNNGKRGTKSADFLMTPQKCADKSPPFANAGGSEKRVSIFKTLTLDVSASFDDTEVKDYWWDLDFDPENEDETVDKDYYSTFDKPILNLGPFYDIGKKNLRLTVRDDALNTNYQDISVEVYVPKITINEAAAVNGIIEGFTEPSEKDLPISLLRKRGETWEVLETDSANQFGNYLTDGDGKFVINDLKTIQKTAIKNSEGKIVAEIDKETGRIIIKDDRYFVEIKESDENMPLRQILKGPEGELVSVILVSDANTDVVIDEPNTNYDKENSKDLSGTHVNDSDTEDEIIIEEIPANDSKNPGGARLIRKIKAKKQSFIFSIAYAQSRDILAEITASGGFYIYDENIQLKLKKSKEISDPVVLEIYENNKKVGEMFVSIEKKQEINFISPPKQINKSDHDSDLIPDSFELIYKMDPFNGSDAKLDFDKDGLSNLEEYLKGTDPRKKDTDNDKINDNEEIKRDSNPKKKDESVFADISLNDPKYDILTEMVDRNVLEGYLENGKYYFKPEQKINRAEFTKIILKTLCIAPRFEAYKAPSVFNDIAYKKENLLWFYDETKESYLRSFITGYLGEKDKNGKAPFKPANTITFAEAAKIILEALEHEDVIHLKNITLKKGEAWYAPYIEIAQDLSKYLRMKKTSGGETYILTEDEAKNPNKELTRMEFVEMASRVFRAYDCTLFDKDLDSIADSWEMDYSLDPNNYDDRNEDQDKDGLTNFEEYIYGTDPTKSDTDGGGENDKDEISAKKNPLDPSDDGDFDADKDGLSNSLEIKIGSNPNNPDTDGGGVNDGDEYNNNSDPLYSGDDDPDKDGLINKAEIYYNTDPNNPDSDGGGVNDGKEVSSGSNPNDKSDDDSDGDGLSDIDEINRYLTDPNKFDTDNGGENDGSEVSRKSDPLDKNDDKKGDLNKDSDNGGDNDAIEIKNGTNPLNPNDDDPDKDGLSNKMEQDFGSDPNKKDTDDGGIDDFKEFNANTDPKDKKDDFEKISKDSESKDADGDYLSNEDEKKYGTDMNDPDTDNGGIKDGQEVKNGTNPLNGQDDYNFDSDNDGLTNDYELKIGTDPYNPDTDLGGIPDGKEVALGLNPLKFMDDVFIDSDGDGLTDEEEKNIYGTDPNLYDTDSGGLDDGTEVKHGSNPLNKVDDKILDQDGDGLTDKDEINIYKTDPKKADTDGGGMNDGDEVKSGSDPLNKEDDDDLDRDNDTLYNLDEVLYYRIDPDMWDSDEGGVNDGDEVRSENNPQKPEDDKNIDSDGDGLSNNDEKNIYGTDPKKADTDSGGINDGQEVKQGLNPLDSGDDSLADLAKGLEAGIYVFNPVCDKCPCPSTIVNSAQIMEGDILFTAIMSRDRTKIYTISNFVQFKELGY